ncbi:Twinfilin-1 [Coemansia sp. RSA 455]|nr:Twinfilin-1 [Coemansia sp. RSA 455]
MTHQSGIRVSAELSSAFIDALSSNSVRALKISIVNESLETTDTIQIQGTLEEDFAQLPQLLDASEPCYLLVRLDDETSGKWLIGTYVPDSAKVRAKMLYASSKAAVTKSLGESYFVDDIFGTTREEFSPAGYRQHRRHVESSAPLTEREEEMQRIREMESSAAETPTMDTRRQHVSGATVAMNDELRLALGEYIRGSTNFVLVAWDPATESFVLDRKAWLESPAELMQAVAQDSPCYAFYWYGGSTSLFVYSCPSTSNVRQRMVYSSFKYGFLVTVKQMGVNVHVKMEVDSIDELSAAAIAEEVEAKAAEEAPRAAPSTQPKFKRPAPPGRPRTNPTLN